MSKQMSFNLANRISRSPPKRFTSVPNTNFTNTNFKQLKTSRICNRKCNEEHTTYFKKTDRRKKLIFRKSMDMPELSRPSTARRRRRRIEDGGYVGQYAAGYLHSC